jgi:hypothetical protein
MFRFCDNHAAKESETVLSVKLNERNPLYGRDDCLLPNAEYTGVAFRKTPCAEMTA